MQRRFAGQFSEPLCSAHRINARSILVAIILETMVATVVWMTIPTALEAQSTASSASKDAKTQVSKPPDSTANAAEMSPNELVRTTVANEVAAAEHPLGLHMFRSRETSPKGSQTRLYAETKDALVAMMIAKNDQPLTTEQQQAETNHLAWLMNNPDQLRKKAAREKEDKERTLRIVKALPDAFQYEYAGTENGEAGLGTAGSQLVKLKFAPNPSYSPPSRVEEVLAGMQGELLIDKTARRIARIDGTLFREVTFGWGIIGHLNQGGHFLVQQGDLGVGDGSWGITELSLNVTGKILLFKGISLISDQVLSDFQRMPDNLTFAQGVEMLEIEQEKLAHSVVHAPQPSEAKTASQ
jgi:hypothetical protein